MNDESDRERQQLADIEAARAAQADDALAVRLRDSGVSEDDLLRVAREIIRRRGKSQVLIYGGGRQIHHSVTLEILKDIGMYSYTGVTRHRVEKDSTTGVIVDEVRLIPEPSFASLHTRRERREMERARKRDLKRRTQKREGRG